MKIEIPTPNASGSCPVACPLFLRRMQIGCSRRNERDGLIGYVPGPNCLPGVYDLVPVESAEAHLTALKHAIEQAYAEGARSRDGEVEALVEAATPLMDIYASGEKYWGQTHDCIVNIRAALAALKGGKP